MEFLKFHGLGNDFLVLQDTLISPSWNLSELSRDICDRHYGAGADGLIILFRAKPADNADFSVRIFNADGSEAEISGNGIRCVAAYLWYLKLFNAEKIRIKTLAGIKELEFLGCDRSNFIFRTDMGKPILDPSEIPMIIPERLSQVVSYPLEVGSERLYVTATSFGNPHCALFLKNLLNQEIDNIGLLIEKHPVFPNRANVEFVEVVDRQHIKVMFWERGVGRTLSSGSGSCSAAIASMLNDFADNHVAVETPGGILEVEWKNRDRVFTTGSAEAVFRGEYLFPALWK